MRACETARIVIVHFCSDSRVIRAFARAVLTNRNAKDLPLTHPGRHLEGVQRFWHVVCGWFIDCWVRNPLDAGHWEAFAPPLTCAVCQYIDVKDGF